MMTTFSRSQTFASLPKCWWKMPNVGGPQTSWVIMTSTFTQTFSPGAPAGCPAAGARIFSVKGIVGIGRPAIQRFCHRPWNCTNPANAAGRGGVPRPVRPVGGVLFLPAVEFLQSAGVPLVQRQVAVVDLEREEGEA